jgi:ethanolamine utilization protein EutN
MIVGKVIGTIVSTRKSDKLLGSKFVIIEPSGNMTTQMNQFIAIDTIGAGIGEIVLVVQGSAARIGCGLELAPIDAAIVGIVDDSNRME